MDLLIHSMAEFWELIEGSLELAEARHIVEIGTEFGGTSNLLGEYATKHGGTLTCIDPAPQQAFLAWCAQAPKVVRHLATTSHEALPELSGVDAWLIDGDHNWYTVYHELKGIHAASRRDGKPMLVFMHDVGWPTADRDSYYAPERIPEEFRHPYDYDSGVTLGGAALVRNRGFRGMGQWAFARHAGGPRNGVLTAVQDFISEITAAGGQIAWARVPAVFGLGVLFDLDAPWSPAVAQLLYPYHDNPLIARLEINRLRNYLTVIDWQDRATQEA